MIVLYFLTLLLSWLLVRDTSHAQAREHIILDFLESRVTFPASLEHVDLFGLGLPVGFAYPMALFPSL